MSATNGLSGRKATVTHADGTKTVGEYVRMTMGSVILVVDGVTTEVSMQGATIEVESSRGTRLEDEIYDRTDGWVGRPIS